MKNLLTLNRLPPRPEYIKAIKESLKKKSQGIEMLTRKTGLTKTQVACTLEKLIDDKIVEEFHGDKKNYSGSKNEI